MDRIRRNIGIATFDLLYSSFELKKIFCRHLSLNPTYKRKIFPGRFHGRVSKNVSRLFNPNLHNVLDCDWGLHDDGEGHDPLPSCLVLMWCPLRCWFTHCPDGTPGLQSFLHSRRQVVHEQGFGPPPQDNTEARALARTKTLNNPGERAIKSVVKALCL